MHAKTIDYGDFIEMVGGEELLMRLLMMMIEVKKEGKGQKEKAAFPSSASTHVYIMRRRQGKSKVKRAASRDWGFGIYWL